MAQQNICTHTDPIIPESRPTNATPFVRGTRLSARMLGFSDGNSSIPYFKHSWTSWNGVFLSLFFTVRHASRLRSNQATSTTEGASLGVKGLRLDGQECSHLHHARLISVQRQRRLPQSNPQLLKAPGAKESSLGCPPR